ncbi:Uncharacterised protein [Raoultella planticola]|uniref:Uncharacterized protein n=1 Tax=Raoultella planticola TaxID=575 RepID=A0A485AE70_RAOPL|nr:Uncharacterised protein [Raoultella planticola]
MSLQNLTRFPRLELIGAPTRWNIYRACPIIWAARFLLNVTT